MGAVDVTIISGVYGDYTRFVPRWLESLDALERKPDAINLVTEDDIGPCSWKHQYAFYFDHAWRQCSTEWVWVMGVDDLALPSGLNGIDDVDADVWLTGYEKDDTGEIHIPQVIPNAAFLLSGTNMYTGASMIRTETLERIGGFRDRAFMHWDLWRRLARANARFESTGRVNFMYMQHDDQMSRAEWRKGTRAANEAEMDIDVDQGDPGYV